MIDLILDTNILIEFLAKDAGGIYAYFKEKYDRKEIKLITNNVIIDEWNRNRQSTIKKVVDSIEKEAKKALSVANFLGADDRDTLKELIKFARKNKVDLAMKRIAEIDRMLRKSTKVRITNKMRLQAVDYALKKKAPFTNKQNSVADALIVFSTVEHFRNSSFFDRPILVSFNHTDFSDPENIDLIHPDLKQLFESSNIRYNRNIADVLNLVPDLIKEIDDLMEEYIDRMIDDYVDTDGDLERGR